VRARQGQSTVVAPVAVPLRAEDDRNPLGQPPAHDFRPGAPTTGSFPRKEWQRSLSTVLREAPDDAFGYGDPRGRLELREALAEYVARTRKVHAEAGALRIYAGFASSLGFLAEMFLRRGINRIAVEQPMLPFHRQILELAGLKTVRVPVDDQGLSAGALIDSGAQAVLVTPSNHQPLGVTMSAIRRNELIEWADTVDGWIIEDDYDGEFRYDRHPIGALQGLNADRVVYGGTASKAMGPGVHVSWLVVPSELRRDLAVVTHLRAGVSTINQLALADLLNRGDYDRHVRHQRRSYQRRRADMHALLAQVPWLQVAPGEAGMHLVANIIDSSVTEADVLAVADRISVGLTGLQTHFEHDNPGLVINVTRPPDHHIATATDVLIGMLCQFG